MKDNHWLHFTLLVIGTLALAHRVDAAPILAVAVGGPGVVTSDAAGISCPPTCKAQFPRGTHVSLTAEPADNNDFAGWTSPCPTGSLICEGSLYRSAFVGAFFVPSPPVSPPAPVPVTGQTTCYDTNGIEIDCAGTGQDGEYSSGVALPQPRFIDNGYGTVTDNLTDIIWLRQADCFHGPSGHITCV